MTWFGTVSAWAALAVGFVFLAGAIYEGGAGGAVTAALYVAIAGPLFVGAYRTLRQMPGGLRLLCGAWGIVTGLQAVLLVELSFLIVDYFDPNLESSGCPPLFAVRLAILCIAIAGLALTVLHKERK